MKNQHGHVTMQQGGLLMHTNYTTPLRALLCWLVLAIGATGVFAAGTWQEFPSGYTNNEILSCTMGNDGTVYYQIPQWGGSPADTGPGIFAKKNDNNPAENLLSKLPASFVGKRYGVYYDKSRDSLYVGGIDGQVYRGRDGIFTAMPSIPLLYTRLDGSGFYQVKYTHVNGFVRDPKDRLLAVTDSLAWYLDTTNQTWIPIGTDADYLHPPLGSPYFSEIAVYPNGNVFIDGCGNGETSPTFHWMSPDLKLTGVPRQSECGMTIGNSGKIYSIWGIGQRYKYADPSKGFQWDTVFIKYPPEEGYQSQATGSVYEDPSGVLWVGQSSRILLMKGDSILFSIPQNLGPVTRFLRAPDNTFWGCAQQGLIRYSTKYALPPEITGGVAIHQHSQSSQNSLHVVDQGIVLQTQQAQMFRVLDLRGRLLWQGSVLGEQRVALPSGTWIVSAVGFQKLVFVP